MTDRLDAIDPRSGDCDCPECEAEAERVALAAAFELPPHLHSRECYDDPGPGRGPPQLICGPVAGEPETPAVAHGRDLGWDGAVPGPRDRGTPTRGPRPMHGDARRDPGPAGGIDYRRWWAAEAARRFAEAEAACGPGSTVYGRWLIEDNTGLTPDRVVYCRPAPGGGGWRPGVTAGDERMPPGPWASPSDAFGSVVGSCPVRTARYSVSWSVVERYRPLSEEELAGRRGRRGLRQREREAEAMPLFAAEIREASS